MKRIDFIKICNRKRNKFIELLSEFKLSNDKEKIKEFENKIDAIDSLIDEVMENVH